jgi:hypothetical protein
VNGAEAQRLEDHHVESAAQQLAVIPGHRGSLQYEPYRKIDTG